jgi:hypothetical protein
MMPNRVTAVSAEGTLKIDIASGTIINNRIHATRQPSYTYYLTKIGKQLT